MSGRFFAPYDTTRTSYTLSNIYMDNVNFTGNNQNLFYSAYPVTIENVTLNNVDLRNNVLFMNTKSLKNVNLTKVNSTNCLIYEGSQMLEVDGFNCTDVNGKYGFLLSNIALSNFNFNHVNFTERIGKIYMCTLTNSEFNDFKGPIVLDDDNELSYVTFTNGVNNTKYENGTALYVTGEYNVVEHCTFDHLMATNGGALYVIGQAISVLDSNITNCNTTYGGEGGAAYIVGRIGYYVDKQTRAGFSGNNATHLQYYNIYDELAIKGQDIVYVSLTRGSEDGNGTFEDPVDNLKMALVIVNPEGMIVFLGNETYNTVFGGQKVTKNNVTIYGNDSTIVGQDTLVVDRRGRSFTINDLIFTGCESTAVQWKGIDGKLVNCTFRDNNGENTVAGGALQVMADNLEIVNSTFINNIANPQNEDLVGGGGNICQRY